MPIPIIIGGVAAAAGAISPAIAGGIKVKKANDTMKQAKEKIEKAEKKYKKWESESIKTMDSVGKQELRILSSFDKFSSLIEKIQERPEFEKFDKNGVKIPKYKPQKIKEVSIGANVLLESLKGAAVGSAGGVATAGATTASVIAFGTASTGTAISTLSGAAAYNAILAALGGGSIAAGGGGMALGAWVLGGAAFLPGVLIGGVIFNFAAGNLSKKADEAYKQAEKVEKSTNEAVAFYKSLCSYANRFQKALTKVEKVYNKNLEILNFIVNFSKKTEWYELTEDEKLVVQNTILLVGLLYKMCQVKFIKKNKNKSKTNRVNEDEIENAIFDTYKVMRDVAPLDV